MVLRALDRPSDPLLAEGSQILAFELLSKKLRYEIHRDKFNSLQWASRYIGSREKYIPSTPIRKRPMQSPGSQEPLIKLP